MSEEVTASDELLCKGIHVDGEENPVNIVTVRQADTLGVLILGVLAFVLLFALQKSEARNRALMAQLLEVIQRRAS